MKRFLLLLLLVPLLAGLVLPATPAFATVGPPIRVRWSGEWPAPARPGVETIGRIELSVNRAGIVDDLQVAGAGWEVRGLDTPRRFVLPPGSRRVVTFRAVPTDPAAPLVITGTVNGREFRKEYRLDAARLERIGKPNAVRATAAPVLSGTKGGGSLQGGGRNIRFRGRFMYERGDGLVGADNLVVRVMDADPLGDEEIGRFLTDPEGEYDRTLFWDDCDISGCDEPDLYLIYEAANLVVEVRSDDGEDMYTWSTAAAEITDFTGTDIDFGLHIADSSPQAVHIFNSIIRSHRFANLAGGMNGAHVMCHWPSTSTNGAFYSDDSNQIHIGVNEEWNEGTIIHEYGHRLTEQFSVLDPPNYINGFCDPGHCVWCPENTQDAWQEGFANWFGSVVIRNWIGQYDETPLSSGDLRYVLEAEFSCSDNVFYATGATEGYVGLVLRDIEDIENEDVDGGAADCEMDVLALGAGPVFTVFRDDDPRSIGAFVTAFRARYPQHDSNLWATLGNSLPAVQFTQPAPSVTSQPAQCRVIRPGEAMTLTVVGDGALHTYQWRRNGVTMPNGGGFNGATTASLVFNPVTSLMAGDYDCVVTTCDGSLSVTSTVSHVDVDLPPNDQPLISWGENGAGQVGNGTQSQSASFHLHPTLSDVVAADGGRVHSMALRKDGTLLTWGHADYGALGNGQYVSQVNSPQAIADSVVRIAAGKAFSLALLRDGTVRSWGWNFYGTLFTGNQDGRNVPSPTILTECVRDITAGDEASYALLDDGTVRAVGYNGYGSLGNGTMGGFSVTPVTVALTNVVAIDAAGFWCMALRADSTVWTWGINTNGVLGLGHYNSVATPTQVPGLTGIVEIAAGHDNAHVRRADGRVFGWGYGPAIGIGWNGGSSNVPQLLALTDVDDIDSGASYAAALIDGRLMAWGLNAAVNPPNPGVLGNAGPYVQGTPIDVPTVHSISGFGAGWGTLHAFGALGVTGVEDPPVADVPTVLALRAGPNPARDVATIAFDLPDAAPVSLRIYDVAGRFVHALVDEAREAGRHTVAWDGRTASGVRAAAGMYFLRLKAGERVLARPLLRVD